MNCCANGKMVTINRRTIVEKLRREKWRQLHAKSLSNLFPYIVMALSRAHFIAFFFFLSFSLVTSAHCQFKCRCTTVIHFSLPFQCCSHILFVLQEVIVGVIPYRGDKAERARQVDPLVKMRDIVACASTEWGGQANPLAFFHLP